MTTKSLAITLAIIIVISWTHCYNRIAKLERGASLLVPESTALEQRGASLLVPESTALEQRGASLLVPESTALEQHIAKIISLPCKNIFGQQYVPLQEVLAWRTKALAIVKELKNA